MQLFIVDFEKNWERIKIGDRNVLDQIRKVLRMKKGEFIFVQREDIRYKVQINDRDNQSVFWTVIETIIRDKINEREWLAIAMPNKWDKVELIVQKLSEIWIKKICFWVSERSIIRERSEKKIQRIKKIAKEAVEQSWGRYLPEIIFEENIFDLIRWKNVVVFDKTDMKPVENFHTEWMESVWIIWPEWWLTQSDYEKFWDKIKTISLWDTVLRTETASIIAARYLKNFN